MNVNRRASAGWLRGPWDEGALRERLESARSGMSPGKVDLALVFLTPHLVEDVSDIMEVVQVHGRTPLVMGCTGVGVSANDEELEQGPALAFLLLQLPGATVTTARLVQGDVEEANGPGWWHAQTGVNADSSRGWLAFGDPYSLDTDAWLGQWNEAYPGVPTLGGMAAGGSGARHSHLFLNQQVFKEGVVAVSIAGRVALEPLVSQGCRPIGRPWTITAADRNLIQKIGNLPALSVLQTTYDALPAQDKARASGNLFVGLAVNEYQEEHRCGDFLIRNLLAADPASGTVAVGARVRVGQTVQFQFRDGAAADEDLSSVVAGMRQRLAGRDILGACLCSCAGRGSHLFGKPHHDAVHLHVGLEEPLPLAGFFCNGEIGPVGGRTFLHGYTAAAAVFVGDGPTPLGEEVRS